MKSTRVRFTTNISPTDQMFFSKVLKRVTVPLAAILLLLAGWAGFPQTALAQTITQTDTITLPVPSSGNNLVFAQFDPAQGVLTNVEIQVTGEVSGLLRYENLSSQPNSFTVDYNVGLSVGLPDNTELDATGLITESISNVPASDGNSDFGGTSGGQLPISAMISNTISYTSAAVLDQFFGPGAVSLPITSTSFFVVSGQGPALVEFDTNASTEGRVTYTFVVPDIALTKLTNGVDADAPLGPFIQRGRSVLWSYQVENTGTAPLSSLSLIDDQLLDAPALVSGDGNNNSVLDLNETWIYQASGSAIMGQYANVATVSGTAVGPVNSISASAADPSHYFGIDPSIDLEKMTNGDDADAAPGPLIPVDDPVMWTYVITNTGNVTVTNVVLTDDQLGAITDFVGSDLNGDGALSPGEVWIYQAPGTATPGQYENSGTVTGEIPNVSTASGVTETLTVSDSDPSHYFGSAPAIDVLKSASASQVAAGTEVVYTYTVSNTGNVPLTSVVVTDDRCTPVNPLLNGAFNVGDSDQDQSLDLTEQWRFNCVVTLMVDTVNTVTVTGEDPIGTPTLPVTDTESVDVLPTALLTKTADPVVVPEEGGLVTFTVEIENTSGEILLLNELSDSIFGDLNGQGSCTLPQSIEAGAVYVCRFARPLAGTFDNPHIDTATATLTDDEGNVVMPAADAQVDFDPAGSIAVTKTPDVTIVEEAGQNVIFTIVISNTSIADVVTIGTITDSVFGVVTERTNTTCVVPQSIAVGASYSCTFEAFIDADGAAQDGDGDDLVHTNVVTAEGVDESGVPLLDSDEAMVLINPAGEPILALEKTDSLLVDLSSDGFASPGDTLLYELIIRNAGGSAATGVQLLDVVSIYTSILPGQVATSKGEVVEGNTSGDTQVVVDIGTVEPGETVNVSIRVVVDELAACAISIENQAIVTSSNAGEVMSGPIGSNVPLPTVTLITGTDLEVRQSVHTPATDEDGVPVARPGDRLTYTIEVTNSVALTATNVHLDVKLDPSANLIADSVMLDGQDLPPPSYDPIQKRFMVAVGALPPGQAATVTYDVELSTPLPQNVQFITNKVDIIYDLNSPGGQNTDPILDPELVDKCLTTGTGELPTQLEVVDEPAAPPVAFPNAIFIPLVQK